MATRQKQVLTNSAHQKGLVVLTTVTLLLGLASLGALYAAQLFTQQHRVALATVNQLQGKMAAAAMMNAALQQLERDASWQGDFEVLPGQITRDAKIVWTQHELSVEGLSLSQFRLQASGFSEDKQHTQTIYADAIRSPILRNLPRAPLTLPNGLTERTQFEIAANPQGLALHGALSIWSANQVELHPNSVTCRQDDFAQGECFDTSISNFHSRGTDIVDSHELFPEDMFAHIFDFALAEYPYVKDKSTWVGQGCGELNDTSKAMIWILGDCTVKAYQQVGSQLTPVILVVESGKLRLESFSNIHGLVFMFDPALQQPNEVRMSATSVITGALVLSESLHEDSQWIRVAYDKQVLHRLQTDPQLQRIILVAGSWRDYDFE